MGRVKRLNRSGLALLSLALMLLIRPAAIAAPGGWDALATQLLLPVAEDGQLPNSAIPMALASSGDDFLWVGTQNGLARWDGLHFRIYNADGRPGSLPDSLVETLHTDRSGRLWIGTLSGGLALYDPHSDHFKSFTAGGAGLSHVGVHAIADASGERLWVGTEGGLDELTPSTGAVRHITPAVGQTGLREALAGGVTALQIDGGRTLWIGTPHGLLKRDLVTGAISAVTLSASEAPTVNVLMIAADGRLWVGTDGKGAYVVNRDGRVDVVSGTLHQGLSGSGMRVHALLEMSKGEIWLGTYDNGVQAVDPVSLKSHRVRLGNGSLLYGDQNIRALHRAPGGQVFIGANGAITRYDPRHPAFATMMGGEAPTAVLAERTPVSLFKAQDHRIWVGFTSHGVDVIDPITGRVTHTSSTSGLPKVTVRGFGSGDRGTVILGTDGGLFVMDAGGRKARRLPQPGRAQDARVQDVARQGRRLWVAGRDGVWGYSLGADGELSAEIRVPADQLTDRRADDLTIGPRGELWIGTDSGLNRYDPITGRVERILPGPGDNTTPRGFISSVTFDSAGRMWVTTFGHGVSVAMTGAAPGHALQFRRIDIADGLPNSNANKVVEDKSGYIWVSTDSGLARIDPKTFSVRAFQIAEGVPVGSFFYNAGLRTDQGELLFAGRGGLQVVRPERLIPVHASIPLVVTEVRMHGRLLDGNPFADLPPGGALRVPSGDSGLEIGFAALDYGAPGRVRYAYRLAGQGRNWTDVDANRRLASFSTSAPGAYQLEIRASDPSGSWEPRTLRLPITVIPAWNQTVWFYLLVAALGLIVVLLLIRWRTQHLQDQRLELEMLVAERTSDLEAQAVELAHARARAEASVQAKSEFLANMSHEIRTPLNGVIAVADMLTRSRLQPKEHEMAEIIRASGETLQRLLSDILDVARIESGKIAIEAAPFHAGDMVRAVAGLWQMKCDEKGVRLSVEIDPSIDETVMGDLVRVRQVVTNLLSNAVKFTEKGEVRLTATRTPNGHAQFSVSDTGVGFSMADKAKVLGRFEQADSSITRRFGGTGLGLSICCDLAGLMGGALDCESEPGVGSRFWMDLTLEPTAASAVSEVQAPSLPDAEDRPLRVLLADDHPTNRKVVELMLDGDQVELISVEDGAQALESFRTRPFDLVLMDMQMPVMDGLTAIVEIRRLELERGLPRTPIIMLTANALPEHVAAAAAAGADGHLAKPFTASALYEALNVALSGAQSKEAAA